MPGKTSQLASRIAEGAARLAISNFNQSSSPFTAPWDLHSIDEEINSFQNQNSEIPNFKSGNKIVVVESPLQRNLKSHLHEKITSRDLHQYKIDQFFFPVTKVQHLMK